MNTKMITIIAGLASLTAAAQEAVPEPVVVPAPAEVAVVPVQSAQDFAPGAICHIYKCRRLDEISKTPAREQGYDMDNETFSAGEILNRECGDCFAVWEGGFFAKKPGVYTFKLTNINAYGNQCFIMLEVNGAKVGRNGTAEINVALKSGLNAFKLTAGMDLSSNGYNKPRVSYRLSTSMQPAKNLTPAMILHPIVDDDDF